MSACGTTVRVATSTLLPLTGSAVVETAVAVTDTVPPFGATNVTLQTIESPNASAVTGVAGRQLTCAPGGRPETEQLALAAVLGPLFKHLTVPETVEPANGLAGKPCARADMSASATTPSALLSTLLAGAMSEVKLPAVVLILSPPLAGAGKVLVQVMLCPTDNTCGSGFGAHVCEAPAGSPLKTHVGLVASLPPKFVHTPLTVTGEPAFGAVAGTVVNARISASGTMPTDC
jgi:hypothetical protein